MKDNYRFGRLYNNRSHPFRLILSENVPDALSSVDVDILLGMLRAIAVVVVVVVVEA